MPLLVLTEKHKKDLKFLQRIDTETLDQFCQIARKFISDGFDKKIFLAAANKFGLSPEPLKKAIEALCYLFSESGRLKLSETDFIDSLLVLAYSDDVNDVLKGHYLENLKTIRTVLGELAFDLPHYHNLSWRLDVILASRSLRNQVKPLFLLQLDTKEDDRITSRIVEAHPTDLRHITTELEAALGELKQGYVRRVMRNVK